jgi:hypothetical protein
VGIAAQPAVRHAVGLQSVNSGKAQLQGMKAKHVSHGTV